MDTDTAAFSEPVRTPLNEDARTFTPSLLFDEHRALPDERGERDRVDSVPREYIRPVHDQSQYANICSKVHYALNNLQERFGEEIVPNGTAQDLKKIKQILEQKDISISVFGKHNCGKSTLLNALLGDDFLPVYQMSETSVQVRIQHDMTIHEGICGSHKCPHRQSKICSCPCLEVMHVTAAKPEVFYGPDDIYAQLEKINKQVRKQSRESPNIVLKANIPILVGSVPDGWTVSLVDNPGFGEAKEHISRLANVSMKISSAYIYLLETGSVGGEEAAKFFKKLMKRESLSCALTDGRLVVGITKFDLNYNSHLSQRRGQSRSITIDDVRQKVLSSIKEATSVDISEDSVLRLCSDWALISTKLTSSLIGENNEVKEATLRDALSCLEKYPYSDYLPSGQGERLTQVNHEPHKVIECLDKASGIHALTKWIRHVVEVACVKAWATNLCNQLKSCADRVDECICAARDKKGINVVEMEADLKTSMSQYEAIMDAKHKIKLQICKKGMDLTPVWKDLQECYRKDLEESKPQDEGKAKVREMIEKFKKICMEKVTRKSLNPAEFKQDIERFLKESSSALQTVFNRTCGFWTTHATVIRLVGKAVEAIGQLRTDAILLCKIPEKMKSPPALKADTEQSPQSSTACSLVEALQPGGHMAEPTKQKTSDSQTNNIEETCQSSTDLIESQRDQLALQAEERPIAAPMLGDIKKKIKIPNVSLQWWERVLAYFRNLFGKSVSCDHEQNLSEYEYSAGEESECDILYSFPVPPSANVESGVVHDMMSNRDSLSDSDTEHTDLQQKEDSLEPSESNSEPETEGDTEVLLKESSSESYKEDIKLSVSRTYKQWTDEFDKVIDELQVHMEQECDVYFEKIKYKVIEYFFVQYRKEVLGRLRKFKMKFGPYLGKEKSRLSELENSIELISKEYHLILDERLKLHELIEQMTYSLSEFYK